MKSMILALSLILSSSALAQVLYPSPYSQKELDAIRNRAIDISFYIRGCSLRVRNQFPFLSYEEKQNVDKALACQAWHGRRKDRKVVCDSLMQNPYIRPSCEN
jgi:hypothetical protein